MFDKEMKRAGEELDTELVKGSKTKVEGSSKRAGKELESDNSKKKKIDEHVEAEGDDDQEEAEMKTHMEININKEDLETLWKLVKAKHGNTRPEEAYESLSKIYSSGINNNVLANEQQHTEQSEPIYDTYMLEKINSNTTPDSTNMCHRGGEIDQDAEQYQVKSPLLNAEFFKMKDMDSPKFHEFFEINKLKAQLQAKNSMINNLKKQNKNVHEKSKEANVKHDIDVIETINIELDHIFAKLLKENETLKKHYKDLYDSIKVTRTKTIEQTTSLIDKNDEFKAQLHGKGVYTLQH
ncbi:hypothetical protein Tco_1081921 [Tanacetum coccineum]|uniref:Uncharacterized protein n=1 Tax=Tanacetum coccineum TaxID=301880 RepID=A0ABQ5HYU1_9ASTR